MIVDLEVRLEGGEDRRVTEQREGNRESGKLIRLIWLCLLYWSLRFTRFRFCDQARNLEQSGLKIKDDVFLVLELRKRGFA